MDANISKSEFDLIFSEFKKKIIAPYLSEIKKSIVLHDEEWGRRPGSNIPPAVIWVIQEGGYKKVFDNPEYRPAKYRHQLEMRKWHRNYKKVRADLQSNFNKFFDIFDRLNFMETGGLVRFRGVDEVLKYLSDNEFKELIPLVIREYNDGDYESYHECFSDKFSGFDFAPLVFNPPILLEGSNDYCDEDIYCDNMDADEYPTVNHSHSYEVNDFDKEINEEFTDIREGYARSEEDGWYYDDK